MKMVSPSSPVKKYGILNLFQCSFKILFSMLIPARYQQFKKSQYFTQLSTSLTCLCLFMQTCNSIERRRRRVGGAEVKEEGVETEEGAGNLTGSTPTPHSTGVGVSTRRTTYVMVS